MQNSDTLWCTSILTRLCYFKFSSLFPSLICIAIIRFCLTLLVVETQPIRWRKKQIAERVEEKQPHIYTDRCWRYLWDVCSLVEESGGTRRCGGSPGSLGRAASSGCQWRDSNANRPVGTKVAVETLGLMTSCLHNGTSTFISSLAKCRRRSRRRGGPIHPNIKTHTNGIRIVDVNLEIAFDFYVSTITVANRSDGCWALRTLIRFCVGPMLMVFMEPQCVNVLLVSIYSISVHSSQKFGVSKVLTVLHQSFYCFTENTWYVHFYFGKLPNYFGASGI